VLFNVYVDELIESLEASGCGCDIDKQLYWCFTYGTDFSYQFAVMTLLEEIFTINVLNQFGACKMLLVGAMDINHVYDLCRWNFLKSFHKRCDSWLNFYSYA